MVLLKQKALANLVRRLQQNSLLVFGKQSQF